MAGSRTGVRKGAVKTRTVRVERTSVTSSKTFDEVLNALAAGVGHPEMATLRREIGAARTYAELEAVVEKAAAGTGLMEFLRFDLGEVVRKERGAGTPRSVRLLVGNPLTMKRMLVHVPDAGSYAPATLLVDEREDGVHVTYDRMASLLGGYRNAEALKVARELDAQVEALIASATRRGEK